MLLMPGLIVGFLLSGPALAIVFAALAGAATIATFAVTIVMGRSICRGRTGVASGVTIGLSIGLGGVRGARCSGACQRPWPARGV